MEGVLKIGIKQEGYHNKAMDGKCSQNFWCYTPFFDGMYMDVCFCGKFKKAP